MAPSLDQLLTAFAGLLTEYDAQEVDPGPGEGNFRCVECRGCFNCRFCVSCLSCEDCTYCEGSQSCTKCTQCASCQDCEDCSHCERCRGCVSSRYLLMCAFCENCTQCFACVGLADEEFCILNERYSRRDYLKIVNELKAEIGRRSQTGWQPPGMELEGVAGEHGRAVGAEELSGAGAEAGVQEIGATTPGVTPPVVGGASGAPTPTAPIAAPEADEDDDPFGESPAEEAADDDDDPFGEPGGGSESSAPKPAGGSSLRRGVPPPRRS